LFDSNQIAFGLLAGGNFLRWIFELRSQSVCVLGAQSNAGRKGLINTDCQ
jgi:hypothetical protein